MNFLAELNRMKEHINVLAQPESRAALQKTLDDLIAGLERLRSGLSNPVLQERAAEIQRPLDEVIHFLEFAKSDEALRTLFARSRKASTPKAKRPPVEIPEGLTNEQIRVLLQKDLSKAELKAIAAQRAISVGKFSSEETKQRILKNLDRQEGYGRLVTA